MPSLKARSDVTLVEHINSMHLRPFVRSNSWMTWTVHYTGLLYTTFDHACTFCTLNLGVNFYPRVPHEVEGLFGAWDLSASWCNFAQDPRFSKSRRCLCDEFLQFQDFAFSRRHQFPPSSFVIMKKTLNIANWLESIIIDSELLIFRFSLND